VELNVVDVGGVLGTRALVVRLHRGGRCPGVHTDGGLGPDVETGELRTSGRDGERRRSNKARIEMTKKEDKTMCYFFAFYGHL
jgi:hypothetical protein